MDGWLAGWLFAQLGWVTVSKIQITEAHAMVKSNKNYNYMRIFNYETQNGSHHRSKAESGLSKLAYFQQSGICKKKIGLRHDSLSSIESHRQSFKTPHQPLATGDSLPRYLFLSCRKSYTIPVSLRHNGGGKQQAFGLSLALALLVQRALVEKMFILQCLLS